MLELLDIVVGAILLIVFVGLAFIGPLLLFGVAAGTVAIIVRNPIEIVLSPLGERGARVHPIAELIRFVFGGAVPGVAGTALVVGVVGALVSHVTGPLQALFQGTSALLAGFVRLEDAAMLSWTGFSLAEVLQRASPADAPHAVGMFGAFVIAHVYEWLHPGVSFDLFRWSLEGAVLFVALASVGASPLRLLRGAGRRRRPLSESLAIVTARNDLGHSLVKRLARCGFHDPRRFESLEELSRAEGRDPQIVVVDVRTLRAFGTGRLPPSVLRRMILVLSPGDAAPEDSTRYAALLLSNAGVEEWANATRGIIAAQASRGA